MNNIDKKLSDIISIDTNEKIILFGAAHRGERVLVNLLQSGIKKNNILFCDDDSKNWGQMLLGVKVISIEELKKLSRDVKIIISSSTFYLKMKILKELGFTNTHYFHSLLYPKMTHEKYSPEFMKIDDATNETCYMDSEEKYTIYSSMKAVIHLPGSIAELGVYKGGSAKILCEIKSDKKLYLFDTFEGLPEVDKEIDLAKNEWFNDTSFEKVRDYLKEYKQVCFFVGIFPETITDEVSNDKFSFVNLDTDLYKSTLDGLRFFWPRMVTGGRIVSHDYNTKDHPGVKKAFEEFFKNNREKVVELADSQVMVIK